PSGSIARRTVDILPGRVVVERISGAIERDVTRQRHRQVSHRYGYHATRFAMDDRDRAAPIALPRNAPIPQAKVDLAFADGLAAALLGFEPPRDLFLGLRNGHAIEKARIDHAVLAVIGGVAYRESLWILTVRADNGRHRQF